MAVLAVEEFTPTTGALVGAGALAFLLGGIRLQSNRRDREAHRAIVPVVHGYILLLAGIASSRQPDWLVPLLVFYGSFWVVMRNRTEQSQV
jgi:membrane-bound ClpP family serine protease